MSFRIFAAAAGAALALGASQAAADTIPLSGSFGGGGGITSFYVANFDFSLPTNFVNARLTIDTLSVDDRGVLQLNGANVYQVGIFGYAPGGFFDFNDGAGSVSFPFFHDNGVQNALITGGFVSGLNTLRLLVNDTGQGIYGTLTGGGPTALAGTTGYNFSGRVDYDLRTSAAVPEPGAWALMILGFGSAGAALRRRRPVLV